MGQALRYVLFLTFESMILQCKQSLFFLLSHNISEHARGVTNEATRYKLPLPQSLLLCIINLHAFTFSLTAGGSEERRTTARGLLLVYLRWLVPVSLFFDSFNLKKDKQKSKPKRGVIFTRARVSLALLSLRKNGDYS